MPVDRVVLALGQGPERPDRSPLATDPHGGPEAAIPPIALDLPGNSPSVGDRARRTADPSAVPRTRAAAAVRREQHGDTGGGARPLVLIYRALGLGDFLAGVPAYRAIADAWPSHRIALAAPPWLRPLAAATGVIDVLLPARPLDPLSVDENPPEVAVNLHGRGPESHRVVLGTRPRGLIAFSHPDVEATSGMPGWRPGEHEVVRWCRLLDESGVPADPSRLDIEVATGALPPEAHGATVVHPGAASAARRWPVGRWAAVARAEVRRGRPVLVTGSDGEVELARAVADGAGLPSEAVVAGGTDLAGLARVVAVGGRVVCGDTGIAHLATALGTPSLVLFGPTSPEEWGPPPGRPLHKVMWAGRTGDPHAATPDPGLLQVTVEDVLDALEGLPSRLMAP